MESVVLSLKELQGSMNVSEFARFLGVNQKTLDNYIKGIRKPTVDFVLHVCTKCGISCDRLLGLTDTALPSLDQQALAALLAEKDAAVASQKNIIDCLAASVKDANASIKELTLANKELVLANARLIAESVKKDTTPTPLCEPPTRSIQTTPPLKGQSAQSRKTDLIPAKR